LRPSPAVSHPPSQPRAATGPEPDPGALDSGARTDHDRQRIARPGQKRRLPAAGLFSAGQAGAFLGLRPRQSQSGDSDPQHRISKTGNVYLRSLLVQAAHYVLGRFGPDSQLRRWGLKLAASGGKRGKKRAIVAVARKLAVILHRMWQTGNGWQAYPQSRNNTASNNVCMA
jgi:hypothetical protein